MQGKKDAGAAGIFFTLADKMKVACEQDQFPEQFLDECT
jgi:hypothetical protein